MWEGVGDRTELQYIDPHSYGRQRCVFLVLQMLNRRPSSLLDDGFLYCILSATSLDPNSIGAPRAPSAWCGFPYHISSIAPSDLCLTFVLTELYNSSMATQSPTWSLEWHVLLSSSGNNCHAVHRSLSSGASVYECTMGIFSLSHFVSQFPPTQFPLITAIRMCHLLPVHHLGMAFLAGSKVKIQQKLPLWFEDKTALSSSPAQWNDTFYHLNPPN